MTCHVFVLMMHYPFSQWTTTPATGTVTAAVDGIDDDVDIAYSTTNQSMQHAKGHG